MRDTNLVNALREHAEWAEGNQWETPITLGDDLAEAADQLENQNAHIAALQQEIERLRGQNEQLRGAAALVAKESAELLEQRWIPVDEQLPENEQDVLIRFVRKLERKVYCVVGMAFHTDGQTTTEDSAYTWQTDYIDMPYDEAKDAYIIPEGWWETVRFGEEFAAVDMPVTHWMPLPEPPEMEK